MISQKTLQSTASGVFLAAEENPTNSCKNVASNAELKESKLFAAKLHLMNVEIYWKFNPPATPHFGGIWERLVQLFKLSLYKVIGSKNLTDEILSTVSCELEESMISRTLSNVPYDINDPLLLTPNHFLLGRSSVNWSTCVFIGEEKNLSKVWRSSQQFANHFWNPFLREFLPTQPIRCKWLKTSKILEVADLV